MNLELEYSAFWLFVILVLALLITWFSYRKKRGLDDVPKVVKTLLYLLRFGSVFSILILLLGLLVKTYTERVEPPILIIVSDNSASMLNYKDSSEIPGQIKSTIQNLRKTYGSSFNIKEVSIGSIVNDSMNYKFDEANSNLEEAFNYIHTNYYNRNVGGIAFISDGNFNVGANPIYNAGKIRATPIFTLAVGDSIQKKDQIVKNVFNNPLAFLQNEFPVEIDISAYQYPDEESIINIIRDNKIIASKKITFNKGPEDFKKIRFLLPADVVGYQTYTVQLINKPDEISFKNNVKQFYVEILDSRNKVLIISDAPHPDISALKNVLSTDDNIECETLLFKDWTEDSDNTNLVICHSPKKLEDFSIIQGFKNRNIPILYIIGPETNNNIYKDLGLKFPSRAIGKSDDVQASKNINFSSFTLNDELEESLKFYPPLRTQFGDFKAPKGSSVLLNQRIGSILKKTPLLFFLKKAGHRYGVIMGEGIWRWRMNEYQRKSEHKIFDELFNKTIQFLTVPGKSKGLSVRFPKRINKEEALVVDGVFYNESLEAITSPVLSLEISDEENKKYNSQFSIYENGYRAQLGKLNPGRYDWVAKALLNNKTLTKKGSIIVEDIDKERSESVANHSVLKQLAVQSNGGFYKLSAFNDFIKDLGDKKEIASVSYTEELNLKLIDYTWFLVFCALLLCSEWFLKRRYGLF